MARLKILLKKSQKNLSEEFLLVSLRMSPYSSKPVLSHMRVQYAFVNTPFLEGPVSVLIQSHFQTFLHA